jgi:hypothetical protein
VVNLLKKCVLVCANCHGEIEAGLLVGPPAGATYEDVLHIYGSPTDGDRAWDGWDDSDST